MNRPVVLDLYAGAGGWDEGVRLAGLGPVVGLEIDHDACRTAVAAGHPRIRADVATYPTAPFAGKVARLLGSPPCQAWSMAGKRLGEQDRARVHRLVDRYATGDPAAEWAWTEAGWADPGSHHAAQPVRWIRDLRPPWVALEQVPAALPLWRHIARVIRPWGYRTWCGVLNAADYGVPQTRQRAFLLASRTGPAAPPEPTHARHPAEGLFGSRRPWVSMAEALGWAGIDRPARTVCGDRSPRWAYGEGNSYATGWTLETEQRCETAAGRVPHRIPVERPGPTVVANADRSVLRNGNQDNACERPACEPGGTLFFGGRCNDVRWQLVGPHREKTNDRTQPRDLDEPALTVAFGHSDMRWVRERPATTVVGDPRIARPGHHGDESMSVDSVRITATEAAVLQSFRPDYPWYGTKTSVFQQIGNAVPPVVAAALLGAQPSLFDAAEGAA